MPGRWLVITRVSGGMVLLLSKSKVICQSVGGGGVGVVQFWGCSFQICIGFHRGGVVQFWGRSFQICMGLNRGGSPVLGAHFSDVFGLQKGGVGPCLGGSF